MWRIGGNIVGAGRYPNAVRRLVQYVIIDFSSHENREFSFYDQGAGTFFLAMCSALIVMFYEKMKSFFPIISSLHGACLDCFFVNASRVFRNSLPGLCRLSGIRTINGKKFDSSLGGTPPAFRLSDLIKGWITAMRQMVVGDKWEVYIPAEMGYGKFSQPGIPAGSTLIFEIELIGIS